MTAFFVARRKVGETWRAAVAARSSALGLQTSCLTSFEAYLTAGKQDFEAAYLALRDHRVGSRQEPPRIQESTKGTSAQRNRAGLPKGSGPEDGATSEARANPAPFARHMRRHIPRY